MKTMAEFEFSPTKNPISLIYRLWPQALRVYVWDGSGSLLKISSTIASPIKSVELLLQIANVFHSHPIGI